MLHNSPGIFEIQSLHVKNCFFTRPRDRTYGLRRVVDEHMYRCFHIIGYIFKIRIILYKLKLGSWGGNILNNTNLFLKKQDRTLCNVFL